MGEGNDIEYEGGNHVTNRIKNLTERDLEILLSIYKYRTLTTRQLKTLFFEDVKGYHYRRIYLLKKEGYLGKTEPIVKQGRKYTSCYFVTEKAIKLLYDKGLIDKIKSARDLRIDGIRLVYLVDVNEVYVQLKKYGWDMLDSRETKEKLNINRNNLIQGMLYHDEGEKYGLYVLSNDPQDITVQRLMTEIKELRSEFETVIVLAKTQDGYGDFTEKLKQMMPQIRVDVKVMPYDIGLLVLKAIGKPSGRKKLFGQYGIVNEVVSDVFEYTVMHRGEEKYIVELLSNSTEVKRKLFAYSPLSYKVTGKKVTVLTWRGFVEDLKEEFRDYPHIEFEGITARYLENIIEQE
jgi:hypothetical protein